MYDERGKTHGILRDDTVLCGIGLHNFELDCSHTTSNEESVSLSHRPVSSTSGNDDQLRSVMIFRKGTHSRKYGFKYTSNRLPVNPSTESSNGRMCTRLPYLMSWHA